MLTDGTRCIRQSSVRSCSYEAVFHSACARFRHLFDSVHPVPRPEGFRRCRFGCSFSYPAEWSAESRKKPTPVIKVTSFLAENKIAPVGTPPKARGIIRAAKGKGNAGVHKKKPRRDRLSVSPGQDYKLQGKPLFVAQYGQRGAGNFQLFVGGNYHDGNLAVIRTNIAVFITAECIACGVDLHAPALQT